MINQTSDRNVYRFVHDISSGLIYINFIETGYKNWETKPLNNICQSLYNFTTINNFYED